MKRRTENFKELIAGYDIKYPYGLSEWEFTGRIKYLSNGDMELEVRYWIKKAGWFLGFGTTKVSRTKWIGHYLFVPIPIPPTEVITSCYKPKQRDRVLETALALAK